MNRLIIIFALLPFLLFGDVVPDGVLVSVWPYKYNGSNGFTKPLIADQSARNVPVSYLSDYFFSYGFPLQISSAGGVNYPVVNALYGSSVTNSVMSEFFYVQGSNGVWYSTVKACPDIVRYANVCARLYAGGYRGPGFNSVYTNASGTIFCNVRPSTVFVEVLTGTNTVYRSLLFSSLSSIDQNISLVSSDLSSLASQYSFVNTNYLAPQSVLDRSAVPMNSIFPNPSDAHELHTMLSTNNVRASEIASALNDLSSDRLTRLAEAWSRTSPIRNDPSYPYYQKSFGEVATDPFLSASLLNEFEGQTFQQKSLDYFEDEVNNTSNAVSTLDAIHTNDLPKQFSVAASNLAQVADIARNFGLVQTTYNNGEQAVKVVVENSDPIIISAGAAIEELIARLIEINEGNSLTVDNIHGVLESILLDCDNIFDSVHHTDVVLGDVFSLGAIGYQAFDFILTNQWTSLLEQQYQDFVDPDQSNYSYWLDRAETDYPDYVASLRDYGFGGNNWWQDNASMTFLNNALWYDLLSKADSSSLSDAFSFITNSLPDSDELVNSVSNVTSRFAESDYYLESITNSIAELTNSVASLDSLYRNTSLPSSFTLFKLNDDVQFTVETDNLSTAFDLLRSGISLVYSVVAVLLLPKFLVIIMKLFMKIFSRFLAISKP